MITVFPLQLVVGKGDHVVPGDRLFIAHIVGK